jgi:Tol biopolymer transport system component
VSSAKGGEATLTQQGDHWPRWSADGKKIVFFSTRDGDGEIFTMNADGSGQTQLTSNTVEDQVPEWTSDGRIVFGRRAGPGHWDIWIMNADGSDERQLTDLGGVSVWPSPSPSANEVAFSSNYQGNFHIYTMRLDGSHLRQVTPNDTVDWGPDWSPSGNDLAFIRETIAPATSAGVDEDVWVIHANGSQPIQVTADPARADTFPTWSPDGRYASSTRRPIGSGLTGTARSRPLTSSRVSSQRSGDPTSAARLLGSRSRPLTTENP